MDRIKSGNVPVKHKIVGGMLLFFAFCYFGVLFFDSNGLTESLESTMLLLFISVFLSVFGLLFLLGIMAKIKKRPALHWILGAFFAIGAFVCWLSTFTMEENDVQTLVALVIVGIVFAVLSVLYLSGIMARIKNKQDQPREIKLFNANLIIDKPRHLEEILFAIDCMEGYEFEHFCADLLSANGFTDVEVTQTSGDQGVDIIAVKDGLKYAIQCKNYSSHVGNTSVQEVCAGKMFYQCQEAVVMTNSTFTFGAKELAKATGVLLWDRMILTNLIKKISIDSCTTFVKHTHKEYNRSV